MKRKLSKKQQKWEDTVKDYATALFIIRHGYTPTDAEIQELLTTPEFRILLFSQLFYRQPQKFQCASVCNHLRVYSKWANLRGQLTVFR